MNRQSVKTIHKMRALCFGIFTSVLLMGCNPQNVDTNLENADVEPVIRVPVEFQAGGKAVNCTTGLTIDGRDWHIQHLAFYVSELAIKTTASENWRLVPLQKNNWQTAQTGLIWFDSGCNTASGDAFNHALKVKVSERTWQQVTDVKFQLAVPFAQNHLNPLTPALTVKYFGNVLVLAIGA